MSSVERVRNLYGDGEKSFRFQRTPSDAMFQGRAVQKLHGNESLPVLLADVVNRADVGVIQCRCGLGFALKAGERLRVACNVLWQEFEGDEAVQPGVLGFVDHAHPATAKFLDDAVVRDDPVDHE